MSNTLEVLDISIYMLNISLKSTNPLPNSPSIKRGLGGVSKKVIGSQLSVNGNRQEATNHSQKQMSNTLEVLDIYIYMLNISLKTTSPFPNSTSIKRGLGGVSKKAIGSQLSVNGNRQEATNPSQTQMSNTLEVLDISLYMLYISL